MIQLLAFAFVVLAIASMGSDVFLTIVACILIVALGIIVYGIWDGIKGHAINKQQKKEDEEKEYKDLL